MQGIHSHTQKGVCKNTSTLVYRDIAITLSKRDGLKRPLFPFEESNTSSQRGNNQKQMSVKNKFVRKL